MKQNLYDFNHHCGHEPQIFLMALYGSLYSQLPAEMDVESIYVDNCSIDGSVDFIKENYPQVKIVENVEPLGFDENNNKGVMASTGDVIGIVNPDIVFTEGSVSNMTNMIKSQMVGVIPS